MSFSETVFLFVLALVIFGPKKLPEIARQVGKMLNEFRRASNEFKSQIEQEIAHLEVENTRKTALAPSPTPEGTASRGSSSALSAEASVTVSAEEIAKTEPPATLASTSETAKPESAIGATEAQPATDNGSHPEASAVSSSSDLTHQANPQESHA
jgi:sec-independent protein translocase protein TatB